MISRAEWLRKRPEFPWLDRGDLGGVERFLHARGWLDPDERVRAVEPAGDGNMNLTLRVRTKRRSVVLKQARPWVEKYDHIEAPWDRIHFEARFYERAAVLPEVGSHMPRVLASDPDANALLLEDLPQACDCTAAYAGEPITTHEVEILAAIAAALHAGTRGTGSEPFSNRAMRSLNHQHIFVVPLAEDNGLDLDSIEPGLLAAARALRADEEFTQATREAGERYLGDGPCLVHGDYFPGSWLRSSRGLFVIDPEFGFFGDAEVDVGCALAHFALARQPACLAEQFLDAYSRSAAAPALDPSWVGRYAAAEVMRRLIGVAQLPIPPSAPAERRRAELLERARCAMIEAVVLRLWE